MRRKVGPGIPGVRELRFEGFPLEAPDTHGAVFTQERDTSFYAFTRHQLAYGSRQDRSFTYAVVERFGSFYGGTLNEFRVQASYRATPQFSIGTSGTWDRFQLPLPNGNFSVVLASLQGNYSDSDLYVIHNGGTQFASIAPANPPQVRETRFAVKYTHSFAP